MFATWRPVDRYQPHAHMVGNRLLSAKVNYEFHFHWCARGEYIHTYARTSGYRMHVFTLNVRMRLQVKWACRVLGRYSVGQEWRGWLRVCSQVMVGGTLYTFEVGTRNPTSPPVGSPFPVFSRIWFTKSEVWPATGGCTVWTKEKVLMKLMKHKWYDKTAKMLPQWSCVCFQTRN